MASAWARRSAVGRLSRQSGSRGALPGPGAARRLCVQPRMLLGTWHPAPKLLACAAFHSDTAYTPRMRTDILGMGRKTPRQCRQAATLSHTLSSQQHSWHGRGPDSDSAACGESPVKATGTEAKQGMRASPLCLGDLIPHEGLAGCSGLPVPRLFHSVVNELL